MFVTSLASLVGRKTSLYLGPETQEAALRGRNLVLRSERGEQTIRLDNLRRLVLVGRSELPVSLLQDLARADIPLEMQDHFGKTQALLWPIDRGWDSFAEAQAAFVRRRSAFELARALILAKVDNCREIIRRRVDQGPDWKALRRAVAKARNPDVLRGHEGYAARQYFALWKGLLHKFSWLGRVAQSAPDPVNMILSFGYSLLRNRLSSALRQAGLDPRLGILHEKRGRHCALASDLMEPLRPLVDGTTLSLLRRQELAPEDFQMRGGRCTSASERCFPVLMRKFEDMFSISRKFYTDPQNSAISRVFSLDDMLDDMAESFALHMHDGQYCLIPRLSPCIGI